MFLIKPRKFICLSAMNRGIYQIRRGICQIFRGKLWALVKRKRSWEVVSDYACPRAATLKDNLLKHHVNSPLCMTRRTIATRDKVILRSYRSLDRPYRSLITDH